MIGKAGDDLAVPVLLPGGIESKFQPDRPIVQLLKMAFRIAALHLAEMTP